MGETELERDDGRKVSLGLVVGVSSAALAALGTGAAVLRVGLEIIPECAREMTSFLRAGLH